MKKSKSTNSLRDNGDCKNTKEPVLKDCLKRGRESLLLWNDKKEITTETRPYYLGLLASYIINGSLCSSKPAAKFSKDILKVLKDKEHRSKLMVDLQRYQGLDHEISDHLSFCLYNQATLLQAMIEQEATYFQKTRFYEMPWKKLKLRYSDVPVKPAELPSSVEEITTHDESIAKNKEHPSPHKNERNNNATELHHSMMVSEYCRDTMVNESKSLSEKEQTMDDIICDLILNDRKIQPVRRVGSSKLNMDMKRFGAVNEAHCETVAQLVSNRLRGESDGPVTLFMTDQFEKSPVQKKIKLALAQACLDSFFFPCAEKAEINCDKDFQQFLRCRIFLSSNPIRDIFGVRYRADDISRIDLVLLIPPGYVGLFRHRDLCFLDTLPNVLDFRKQRMLILRHNQLYTAGC